MEGPMTPASPKRPREDDDAPLPTTPFKAIASTTSTPLSVLSNICTPPPIESITLSAQTMRASSDTLSQPTKRRKITQQEKDDQRLEKEAKAKARAEKKVLKDIEDNIKAEQKRKKAEERDEKKRMKEEELLQKEEEKAKKERAQMRLNAFFVKPKATHSSEGKAAVEAIRDPPVLPVSLLPETHGSSTNSIPPSSQKVVIKDAQSEYERYFLPFNIAPHVIMAPRNALLEDTAKLQVAMTRLDSIIAQEDVCMEPITLDTFKSSFRKRIHRGLPTVSIMDIVKRVNGSPGRPIDLTGNREPLDVLKDISMRYLHFCEDVRPPYYGTYTISYLDKEASRLARNPFSKTRKDTNYDYDSEAEWEEPEEGEDLDSDGEEDAEDEIEDDMDGFLDDEDDSQVKRRLVSNDLQPISTGLCWEDNNSVSRLNNGSGAICTELNGFAMGFLFEQPLQSIDPLSTSYWSSQPLLVATQAATASKDKPTTIPSQPLLAQRTINGLLNTLNSASSPPASTAVKPAKAKRMIPEDQLPAFKAEVEGQNLTKIAMVEALKKTFPKLPKDAITNTLSTVAARVGPTEREKRWVLLNT